MGAFPQSALFSRSLLFPNIPLFNFTTSISWRAFLSSLSSTRSASLEIWEAQLCYTSNLDMQDSLQVHSLKPEDGFSSGSGDIFLTLHYARLKSWSYMGFGYKYKQKTLIAYVIYLKFLSILHLYFQCFSQERYQFMSYWDGRINLPLPLRTCCHQDNFTRNPPCVGAILGTSNHLKRFNVIQKTSCLHNAPFHHFQIEVHQAAHIHQWSE